MDLIKKVVDKPDIIPVSEDTYKRKLGTMGIIEKQLFGLIK